MDRFTGKPMPNAPSEIERARFVAAVADHLPGMVAYWDADLLCRFANKAYLEWFGWTPADLIGTHIRQLLGEDLFARNAPYIDGALGGQRQSFERTLEKPSGDIGHTWAQYIPDVAPDGAVRGFYVLVTDITDLRQTTKALELANAELDIARQKAEAAVEAKSYFLANISHELRTLLTSIVGFSALLKRDPSNPEVTADFAEQIATASQGLMGLVNDLLDHTKLEAQQIDLVPFPCDVRAIAREVAEVIAVQVAGKPVTLSVETRGEVPGDLMLDERRVRQVLFNLVGNAVKFTERGAVRVSIAFIDADRRLILAVEDTGLGISREGQARLFQRFSQVDLGANDRRAGTGLGLLITKQLVELMRGRIGVASQLGEGSIFTLELPVPSASEVVQSDVNLAETRAKPSEVLVVTDHRAIGDFIGEILKSGGHKATMAENAMAIPRSPANARLALVVLHIPSPAMDAPTVLRAIRARAACHASAPVLGFGDIEGLGRDICVTAGFDDFVSTPFQPWSLLNTIDKWLR